MVCAINYADERYRKTQKFNSKMAKKHGADKVIEYTEHDLSEEFKEKNKEILDGNRAKKEYLIKIPLRKYAVPEDVSSAILFLNSDKASMITGQNLIVDGGWTIY